MRPSARAFTLSELLIVLLIVGVLAAFALPTFMRARERANRTKCGGNLRQIGMALLQYADDKRAFPHVGAPGTLDGDVDSSDTPRALRAIVVAGYLDDPSAFVCPSSDDTPTSLSGSSWLRGGKDPTLLAASELSYAYTRRDLTRNASSTVAVLADRGARVDVDAHCVVPQPGDVGNHRDGWLLMSADATVDGLGTRDTVPLAGGEAQAAHAWLRSTDPGGGALPVSQIAGE